MPNPGRFTSSGSWSPWPKPMSFISTYSQATRLKRLTSDRAGLHRLFDLIGADERPEVLAGE